MTVKKLDMAPSWSWAVEALIVALATGTEEGKEIAREELRRLGKMVDATRDHLDNIKLAVMLAKASLDQALEETDEIEGLRQAEAAQETLSGAIAEEEWRHHKANSEKALLERKRRLIGAVLSQLKHDLTDKESFEEAPLEELFSSVPEEVLIGYLPSVCNHREHGVYGQSDFLDREDHPYRRAYSVDKP